MHAFVIRMTNTQTQQTETVGGLFESYWAAYDYAIELTWDNPVCTCISVQKVQP